MDMIAFTIFGTEVRWYAIFLVTGMLLALGLLMFLLKKTNQKTEVGLELFLWVVPMGILFARLFYSVPRMDFPFTSFGDFVQLFAVWEGGLTIIGGIFGGILGAYFCSLTSKKSFARIIDVLVCPVLLGQIVGRWGNYANQELYGLEITNPALMKFPFGVYINDTGSWHYASFFYEGMLNFVALVAFLIVFLKYKDKLKAGVMGLAYIVWYTVVRALLEIIKSEAMTVGGVKVVQTICAVVAVVVAIVAVLTQLGIIKLETKKMYNRHFGIVEGESAEVLDNCKVVEIGTESVNPLPEEKKQRGKKRSKNSEENISQKADGIASEKTSEKVDEIVREKVSEKKEGSDE